MKIRGQCKGENELGRMRCDCTLFGLKGRAGSPEEFPSTSNSPGTTRKKFYPNEPSRFCAMHGGTPGQDRLDQQFINDHGPERQLLAANQRSLR
jgi:hypothetical protein